MLKSLVPSGRGPELQVSIPESKSVGTSFSFLRDGDPRENQRECNWEEAACVLGDMGTRDTSLQTQGSALEHLHFPAERSSPDHGE